MLLGKYRAKYCAYRCSLNVTDSLYRGSQHVSERSTPVGETLTLVVTRLEGAPREVESLAEDVRLWGGAGGGVSATGAAPGRVAATGAGGADADSAGVEATLERGGGGGGGIAAAGLVPNRFRPFAERFAAAAATLPKPGFGRLSGEASVETSTFYRRSNIGHTGISLCSYNKDQRLTGAELLVALFHLLNVLAPEVTRLAAA